jgi:hypothetical protein
MAFGFHWLTDGPPTLSNCPRVTNFLALIGLA